ncbi:MAG: hypothetical protein IIT58_13235, partial [Treponema sp.]|nr:hypothetical protein [Treponema sp.]
MKKNLLHKSIFALFGLTLFSCSGLYQKTDTTQASPDGKTYIAIGNLSAQKIYPNKRGGSLNPQASDYDVTKLTGISLTKTDASNLAETIFENKTYNQITNEKFYILDGTYNFTLKAQLNGVEFSGSTQATIEPAKINTLSFALTTEATYGGLNLTIEFTGEADQVVAEFTSLSEPDAATSTIVIDSTAFTKTDDGAIVSIVRDISKKRDQIESGLYNLTLTFKADGLDNYLNKAEYIVRILPGITTTASDSLVLNQIYKIEYMYYINGALSDVTPSYAEGVVLPKQFSRKSNKTLTLPVLELTNEDGNNYIFGGWFKSEDFSGGTSLSTPNNSGTCQLENKDTTLYAAFADGAYLSDTATVAESYDYYDILKGTRFKNLQTSVNTMLNFLNVYQQNNFTSYFYVDGELTGEQDISTSATSYSGTFIIQGMNEKDSEGNPTDCLKGDTTTTTILTIE